MPLFRPKLQSPWASLHVYLQCYLPSQGNHRLPRADAQLAAPVYKSLTPSLSALATGAAAGPVQGRGQLQRHRCQQRLCRRHPESLCRPEDRLDGPPVRHHTGSHCQPHHRRCALCKFEHVFPALTVQDAHGSALSSEHVQRPQRVHPARIAFRQMCTQPEDDFADGWLSVITQATRLTSRRAPCGTPPAPTPSSTPMDASNNLVRLCRIS